MNIIPVIDIKDGQVVMAKQGQREIYKPINSILCTSSSIEAVVNGFLSIYPFNIIYIADLNAITNTGNNDCVINTIIDKNKQIEFWVDNGKKIQNLSESTDINYKPVIGSEYQNISNYVPFNGYLKDIILSLDFFPDKGYTGPEQLLKDSSLWPQNIIIMTLDRVGENAGPDIERLKHFCQKYPEKNFIAAGGVRNVLDLLSLRKIGVKHVLIASALHSGAINAEIITANYSYFSLSLFKVRVKRTMHKLFNKGKQI
jgi:phosphoribosylformimino-5-aminoimidazole carboxamide ribotide isomerase